MEARALGEAVRQLQSGATRFNPSGLCHASYFEGAQGLLDLCCALPGAQGLPAFLTIFFSIVLFAFLDEGAHGLLGAQGLAAAWATVVAERLLSA